MIPSSILLGLARKIGRLGDRRGAGGRGLPRPAGPPGRFWPTTPPQYLPPGRPLRRGWKCPVAGGPFTKAGWASPSAGGSCAMLALTDLLCRLPHPEAGGPRPGALRPRRPAAPREGRPCPSAAAEQRQHEKNLREGQRPLGSARPSGTSRPNRTAGPLRRGKQPRARPRRLRSPSLRPGGRKGSGPSSCPGGPHNPAPAAGRLSGKFRIIPKK